ncbi:hypothetical protein C3747_78g23 [Trypanosoma cruzi]|uniref:Myotubularin phosphatase domain-containing protein n=2 Tax=Trypanosoma cruzi TaxID=5693 RepID=Q4D1E4_TRYCC|nr:hypothetical protein, conserved [Trypanosoma cruzi]EAN86343.1 hypothetical protein, conserved [Trypanosoma cruzi]PWV09470.1 hypothetical protein C3747_78g23 [Trypanosoma cruzi]RNC59795.1 4-nitrophenylphosphatase [Trypanosoma cruzi]|eukprot:XP_808194.1 hypothetical protein [Trypanosoma cruzi strain CL Brener]
MSRRVSTPVCTQRNTRGERDEDVGDGFRLQESDMPQPEQTSSAVPRDRFLLLLEVDVLEAVEGARTDAGYLRHWQHIRGAGLGPFLFLCASCTMKGSGGLQFVVERPVDMSLPHLVKRLTRQSGGGNQDRPSLRLRCVQSIPLRPKQHEPPLREVVEGPSLFVTKENVVNASPVTVPAETDSSGEVEEEDGVVKDVEEEAFLLSLLRQTSVWNVALLERCGILTSSGGSPCPEWSNWSCVDMAVRAVRYLQQATCTRPQHERAIDIVGMIVEWASVMHAALVVHPRPESHVSQAGAGAVAEEVFSRVPPEITPAQKYPTKNEKSPAPHDDSLVTPGRMTPPRPLLPSSLASVQFPASATKNRSGSRGSGASVETEKTIREAVPLQTHGNTSTPLEMKRRLTTAVKEHDMPFMSVCSEVLEAAFQLQQSHVQSKRSHFRNSDAGERVDGEDGHSADADAGVVSGRESSPASCGGMFGTVATSQMEPSEGCGQPPCSTPGNDASDGSGFLPSLIHRLVSIRHTSSNGRVAGQLSRIAKGDFFPSRGMLDKEDLLRQRLGKTIIVRFYDLDPQRPQQQHQPCLHENNTAQLGLSASSIAAGFFNNTGHPCYLFITHTDIILASVFDDNYPPQSWAATNRNNTAVDAFNSESRSSSGGGSSASSGSSSSSRRRRSMNNSNGNNSTSSGGGGNNRGRDNTLDDGTIYMKHMLVIPRVSLMEIWRPLTATDASMATVLRLQTRSCRRVWLAFQEENELRRVCTELNSGLNASFGNLFLASAQRKWRMTALALVAGDVLPSPHTPFYQQVLQNLLVAFADVESRREHRSTASSEQPSATDGTEVTPPLEEEKAEVRQGELKTLFHFWWLYSPMREYMRQGIPTRQWRLSCVNSRYDHFSSYPATFVVPSSLDDDELVQSADLRARGRVEALSYYYLNTGAGIVRAAQPAAVNICASASKIDVLKSYRRASGMRVCTFDLRSRIRAYANTIVGGGFRIMETGRYCSLANIHTVREAYEALSAAVLDNNPTFLAVMRAAGNMATSRKDNTAPTTSPVGLSTVESPEKAAAAWIEHIHGLLRTATDAARLIAGVSEEDALPPAATGAAAGGAPLNIMHSLGSVSANGFNSAGMNVGGLNDRFIPRSSTLYVWRRAFRPIPFRTGSGSSGAAAAGAPRWLEQQQQNVQSPPSYTQPDNRKNARLVIVNCSDGWDRTTQVCALTELLLDPYFRTVEGFITLLEKEFVSFGHPCLLRSSTLGSHSDWSTGATVTDGGFIDIHDSCRIPTSENCQSSPIILQFLDAVHQLLRLYPHCFEFTEAFLLLIVDLMHAGIVGTFAVNCEADVYRWGIEQQTLSLSQFFAVLFATTIRTDRHQPLEAANDGENCHDVLEEGEEQEEQEPTETGLFSSSAVPLHCFYQSCGGGTALGAVGWDSTPGSNPRRMAMTYDAIHHSGLLNPHFSLADNKLFFGPLLDVVRQPQLQLWERFFLRHNFWCERAAKISQFSEQSASTVHARVVESTMATTMPHSAQPLLETGPMQHPATGERRRPCTNPTVLMKPTDLSEFSSLNKAQGTVTLSLVSNMKRKAIGEGIFTPPARLTPNSTILPGGRSEASRSGNQFAPCTVPRSASHGSLAAFSSSSSSFVGMQPQEHHQKQSPSSFLQRGASGPVITGGYTMNGHYNSFLGGGMTKRQSPMKPSNNVEFVASPCVSSTEGTRHAQQKSASSEPSGAQVRTYNTLLSMLDQAFE